MMLFGNAMVTKMIGKGLQKAKTFVLVLRPKISFQCDLKLSYFMFMFHVK